MIILAGGLWLVAQHRPPHETAKPEKIGKRQNPGLTREPLRDFQT
jgi:hypothetical protein